MISVFFVLSSIGEVIVFKDFRQQFTRTVTEDFIDVIKKKGVSRIPPVLVIGKKTYVSVFRSGLYCVVVLAEPDLSPLYVIESLGRIAEIIKDYCGTLNVKAIRANLFLVHELLEENLDFGIFQCLNTSDLRTLVHYEPVVVHNIKEEVGFSPDAIFDLGLNFLNQISSNAATKPLAIGAQKQTEERNEIFIDVIEKLNITVERDGDISSAAIHGSIRLKSFLHGAPDLKIMLNRDLFVGGTPPEYKKKAIVLDECCFHKCVNRELFSSERTLHFKPPVGECVIFTYIIRDKLKNPLPFRMSVTSSADPDCKEVVMTIKLKCNIPTNKRCSVIGLTIPFPYDVTSVHSNDKTTNVTVSCKRVIHWQIPHMDGGNEKHVILKVKPGGEWPEHPTNNIGPISILFECQSYTCSDINIKKLKVTEQRQNYLPYKWARSVTHGENYIFRV